MHQLGHRVLAKWHWVVCSGLLVATGLTLLLQADDATSDSSKGIRPALRFVVPPESEQESAVDPVKVNGPIFEGWSRPSAALVLSGEQIGFIEPCGCAGLTNQKGGLKRRHTLIKSLREKGWPTICLELGGLVRRYGPQAEIKYGVTFNALATIGYSGLGFGPQDLRLPTEQLLSAVINLPEGASSCFVSANVGLFDFPSEFVAPYRVERVGGRRWGFTTVIGPRYQRQIQNDDVVMVAAAKGLAVVVPKLEAEADFLVLLSHATPQESAALAQQFPQFDLVVTAGGAEEPPAGFAAIPNTATRLVEVGHKGMYVSVVGYFESEDPHWRYQRVPLDHRFEDSPEMQQVLHAYQTELETKGLQGLSVEPQPDPHGGQYIGSTTCGECHQNAYEVWENTPHAHATETLQHLDPPRHFDPECLSCHVTGWHPQEFYPFISGYLSLKTTPEMTANGCENCHGPGKEHALAEQGEIDVTPEKLQALQARMRIQLLPGELEGKVPVSETRVTKMCLSCHDLDNSPDFKFPIYWPDVAHEGVD